MIFRSSFPCRSATVWLVAVLSAASLPAQEGDRPGHVMTPPPAHWKIPPASVVPPGEAAATMALEEGFELSLVASEPMIHDPVALAFDGNGRIWVAEMMGYMPDIDGKLEESTYGCISVIEDTDGDGRADKHTVFLEKYLLPRAVALIDNDRTLLFADNLTLYEAEILDDGQGGIKAGKVSVVDEKYAEGGNPEHKPNGLLRGLDNWIYSAKCDVRYRKTDGKWIKEKTEDRGQWGIAQDDYGRLFTNTNSNLITAEEVPPGVRARNPAYTFRTNTNTTIKDQKLWPARINPGVNRGYMEGTLDENGYLNTPTAASGMAVYRGDQFPERYYGNVFITEPSGNLVKRATVAEGENGFRKMESATKGHEFLGSTDERSRIVSVYTAPDGSLYLVDMYRGILQHRVYMTSYLRAQVIERGLDKHIALGRIWRVTHRDGKKDVERPRMEEEPSAALVAHLSHPNAWWRETAQRLIVERRGDEAVAGLKALVANGPELAAIHAIWTLEGLRKLNPAIVGIALAHPSPRAVAEAIRAAETLAGTEANDEIFETLASLAQREELPVRRQLAASLGRFGDVAVPVLADLAMRNEKDLLLGDLAVSGLAGRELALFKALPPSHNLRVPLIETMVRRNEKAQLDELTTLLETPAGFGAFARTATLQRRREIVLPLLARIANEGTKPEIRKAIADGMLAAGKDKKFKPIPVKELASLALAGERGVLDPQRSQQLAALFEVGSGEEKNFLTTDALRAQFKFGEAQYQLICLGCHQVHGNGQQFLAPPLVGSEWVLQSEKRLIALVMDGVMGPIEVLGKTYTAPEIQPLMPGLRLNPELSDEQLAAILTYVRNAWGNAAPPVSVESVARYRESVEARAPWTAEELKVVK